MIIAKNAGKYNRLNSEKSFAKDVYLRKRRKYCKCKQKRKITTYPPLFIRLTYKDVGGPGFLWKNQAFLNIQFFTSHIQNNQAFSFTDALLGEGVRYETAGSLQNGRRTWILAKLPQKYIISGDEITPYLVFMNSHDGTGAIKAAMTPIRVVCQNTLNLALSTAKRSWSTNHVGDIQGKLEDAKYTLLYADKYMAELGKAIDQLNQQRLSDRKVYGYIDALFPLVDNASEQQKKNLCRMKDEVKVRYFDAPDLAHVGKNAYRFVNTLSDFATHAKPLRERANYRENLFARTVDGNAMIDKAFDLVKAA